MSDDSISNYSDEDDMMPSDDEEIFVRINFN
jgi:hypothetical protein